MPTVVDPADLLIQEASLVPLAEALNLPTDRLLGVRPQARAVLESMGARNIFDLATSRVFHAAAQIEDAATNPNYLVDHSGFIYVMNRDGGFVGTFTPESKIETAVALIRRAL